MTRRPGIRLTAPILALALSACGTAAQGAAPPARPSATHLAVVTASSPAATPRPHVVVVDAAYVADELGGGEQAIRDPATPPGDYTSLGQRQQIAYHRLAAHPDWVPAVLNAVPASVRSAIQDNLSAAQQIGDLNGTSSTLPHWRIIAPPGPEVLRGYYNEAQQASGVAWQYLAAINLSETNMGRIQGLSSAGAQGPMQFMPATWASYGRGDVNNPRDAILAAGRYLQAHGDPPNITR